MILSMHKNIKSEYKTMKTAVALWKVRYIPGIQRLLLQKEAERISYIVPADNTATRSCYVSPITKKVYKRFKYINASNFLELTTWFLEYTNT